MSSEAPAGWYPDQEGRMRYWDGSSWTEHVQPPPPPGAAVPAPSKKEGSGAFGKLKKAAADRQAAKDDQNRMQAEYARAAGALVTSGIFGTSTVEIYAGGFVRVASGERATRLGNNQPGRAMSPGQPVPIKRSTPFEKLHSIKFTPSAHDKASGAASPLEGAVGPAVAKLMKGGKAALKGSVPGLAASGIAHIASAESRTSYLTIATDREIHQLTNQGHNGFVKTTNKGHIEVGLALEAAGNAVLDGATGEPAAGTTGQATAAPAVEPAQPAPTSGVGASGVADRLRELAQLHSEGILSDEEFTSAKAKLLGGL